jgi:hypothetical protein
MSQLYIIGNSNLYCNATAEGLARCLNMSVTVHQATRFQSLDLRLVEASKKKPGMMLVSSLSNLLANVMTDAPVAEEVILKVIDDYVSVIAPPLLRTEPSSFASYLPFCVRQLHLLSAKYHNLTILPEFKFNDIDLLPDKVHLTSDAGSRFLEYLINCIKDVEPEVASKTYEIEHPKSVTATYTTYTTNDVMQLLQGSVLLRLDEITGNKKKLTELEQQVATRAQQNDFVLARLCEESDHSKNLKREDRVIIVGMKVNNYPSSTGDHKDYITLRLRPLIEKILGEIVFDNYVKRDLVGDLLPPFEIRFPTIKD